MKRRRFAQYEYLRTHNGSALYIDRESTQQGVSLFIRPGGSVAVEGDLEGISLTAAQAWDFLQFLDHVAPDEGELEMPRHRQFALIDDSSGDLLVCQYMGQGIIHFGVSPGFRDFPAVFNLLMEEVPRLKQFLRLQYPEAPSTTTPPREYFARLRNTHSEQKWESVVPDGECTTSIPIPEEKPSINFDKLVAAARLEPRPQLRSLPPGIYRCKVLDAFKCWVEVQILEGGPVGMKYHVGIPDKPWHWVKMPDENADISEVWIRCYEKVKKVSGSIRLQVCTWSLQPIIDPSAVDPEALPQVETAEDFDKEDWEEAPSAEDVEVKSSPEARTVGPATNIQSLPRKEEDKNLFYTEVFTVLVKEDPEELQNSISDKLAELEREKRKILNILYIRQERVEATHRFHFLIISRN